MLYFAYGSNMHPGQMQKRCPGCIVVAPARLRDHRLVFSRVRGSGNTDGYGDIRPSAGSVVEGVVWDITETHRQALDEYEGYPDSYSRKDVAVDAFDGRTLTAFAYFARPLGAGAPSCRYLRLIIEGARAHGLSPDYLSFLESFGTGGDSRGAGNSDD
jgi:cation transport regulator ChaC